MVIEQHGSSSFSFISSFEDVSSSDSKFVSIGVISLDLSYVGTGPSSSDIFSVGAFSLKEKSPTLTVSSFFFVFFFS